MEARNTTEIYQVECSAPWWLQLTRVILKLINFGNANCHGPSMALSLVFLVAGGPGLISKVTQGSSRPSCHERAVDTLILCHAHSKTSSGTVYCYW